MKLYAKAGYISKEIVALLNAENEILLHVNTGQKKSIIDYLLLQNIWLHLISTLGTKRQTKYRFNEDWNHTKFLAPDKGGFTRATIHNIFHCIGSMDLFSNLGLYDTKGFEAGNRLINFAVHHANPKETKLQSIERYEAKRYRMTHLLAGGGWNQNKEMCSRKQAKYAAPQSYLDAVLQQNKSDNGLNWLSKILEFKYHANSLVYNMYFH